MIGSNRQRTMTYTSIIYSSHSICTPIILLLKIDPSIEILVLLRIWID